MSDTVPPRHIADPHLMLAFEGTEVPPWLADRLAEAPPAGVTLFREWNMSSPGQTSELTTRLQAGNSARYPLLVAVDQEGGQLLGITGSTPFAGNMALGATGDHDLVFRVTQAMGREMRAVGINVNYAPCADVATQADNPSLGIRSFGDDPTTVATMTAASVEGFVSAGVLPTIKHFPGKGEAMVDPHYHLPILDLDRDRLDTVELPPFTAGFGAGAQLVMIGHYVVPAITGSREIPIAATEKGMNGFLRAELGYRGVIITDALDMGALDQGPAQVVEIIAMMRAGVDLLLCMPDPELQQRVRTAVERGFTRGLIPEETLRVSRARIEGIRSSLANDGHDPDLVASAEHQRLASELALRSITLVRDDTDLLPLNLETEAKVLSLEPQPSNVTPADTTALYQPCLASALRSHHQQVTEIVFPHDPDHNDITSAVDAAGAHDLVVVGTVTATAGQSRLVQALVAIGKPVVTVALRTPFDLAHYASAMTHVCTYSSHQPSMDALGSALFGRSGFPGRLPAAIPDLYPTGHGLIR
ncbi:MAG TPA: glycoside hydrolase family 3 N-terminal domain-containing protein [Acidimicrobiia bacterium]|nr:glycoside hydrolase family 3 N-terminal domain-containing protein [Acidimicrobiia bacterium]